jgi:hypothetical protein
MLRTLTLLTLISVGFGTAATAGMNTDHKIALHILPHQQGTCEAGFPEITDCGSIVTTYSGCNEFDVFPVFFDLTEVRRLEYGLNWPGQWGSCVYTPCAGDNVEGDIVQPGDGVVHEWADCQTGWAIIPGYAWFAAPSPPATLIAVPNPATGFLGVTDCSGDADPPIGIAASGICGVPGDDPCTCECALEVHTWSAVKSLFR